MKIALMGATGFVGPSILKEALDRGHHVTARSFIKKDILESKVAERQILVGNLVAVRKG